MNFKKLTTVLCVTCSFLSGAAFAVTSTIEPGVVFSVKGKSSGTASNCNSIENSISITLSPNVIGAFDCDATKMTGVIFGAAHKKGLLKQSKSKCTAIGILDNGDAIYNNKTATCTGDFDVTGKVFVGSTSGGSIGAVDAIATTVELADTNVKSAIESIATLASTATSGESN